VGQHCPDAGLLGDQLRPTDGILQESDTDPSALVLVEDGLAGKDHEGNRVLPMPVCMRSGESRESRGRSLV
jgi:hypothetical protein